MIKPKPVIFPYEQNDVGDGYAAPSECITRKWTPEEQAKYGNIKPTKKEKTPINRVRKLSMYYACKGISNRWQFHNVEKVMRLWKAGADIREIAEKQGRAPIEVIVLLYDLAENGKIEPRHGGLIGWLNVNAPVAPEKPNQVKHTAQNAKDL